MWWGNVWLNPPFGLEIKDWIARLVKLYKEGEVKQACCITFNSTETDWGQMLLPYPQYFFKRRVKYIDSDKLRGIIRLDKNGKPKKKSSATKGSVFTWLTPQRIDYDLALIKLHNVVGRLSRYSKMTMRVVSNTIGNAMHIAIYTDDLNIKVMVNRRMSDGTMHKGVYRSLHNRVQANVFDVLLYTLRRLKKMAVQYVFIYSNCADLEALRPIAKDENGAPVRANDKKDPLILSKSGVLCELAQYRERGAWYFQRVMPEQIPSTRDMVTE